MNIFFISYILYFITSRYKVFQPPPQAEQFPPKFHGLVLGLVELNDVKGIDETQPIWLRDCPTVSIVSAPSNGGK